MYLESRLTICIQHISNTIFATAALVGMLYCAPLQARLTLAPNADGYQLIDSAELNGPSFSFNDISQTGQQLTLADDGSEEIRFGFGFEFYGKAYYTAYVSANGYISFGNSDNSYNPSGLAIPQPAGTPGWQTPPFIAPWFDDLDPSAGGAVYWMVQGTAPNRRVIVHWRAAHHDDPTATFEFQAILYQGTNRVLFQYKQTTATNLALSLGASATVGIQADDTRGMSYSASQPLLTNGLAIGLAPINSGYIGIVSGPQQQSGSLGQVVSYQVEVINGKSVATDFAVELLPGSSWKVEAPTTTGKIEPKQSKTITVKIVVPTTGSFSGDEIVGFRVIDKAAPVATGVTGGETSENTNTSNNEENAPVAAKPREIQSYFVLKTSCLPAPCFEPDSDGDGVVDSREAASSVANASKIDGFAVLSGASMNIEVTDGTLFGFKNNVVPPKGPATVVFAAGVFNYRALPSKIAGSVVVRVTPTVAWSDRLLLYKVDSAGKYTKIDEKKWIRVENSNAIELTLVDGGEFDEDGVANGVIVDGLAIGLTVDPVAKSDGFGSGGAFYEELFFLMLLVGMRYRRRRLRGQD